VEADTMQVNYKGREKKENQQLAKVVKTPTRQYQHFRIPFDASIPIKQPISQDQEI